jgi:hypothetical protein|tara:strand:- start:11092 stop:12261 length:1170 start_codon:yes stop_codon:yes gene_type:complete
MRYIIFVLVFLFSFNSHAQVFKNFYEDFLKYGTVYVAGEVSNAYETQSPSYFVRTNPENLYDIPQVVDNTVYHPHDYRIGFGLRKLARFDYEIKARNYYDGKENNIALSSPTSAVKGFEYLLHYEKERERSQEFTNIRYFIRHTGNYHIVKFEQREQGNVGFKYTSGEIRARLPIGKKFSLSAGAIYRTHQRPYGYNPIEIWLNETTDDGFPLNPWYSLGYTYGYQDVGYTQTDAYGNVNYDWYWINEEGVVVANTDVQFRDLVFGSLMNEFNESIWSELDAFGEIAPIIGFDFYEYKKDFWLHIYGNWILPYHKYLKGNEDFSYLHRDSWGLGGHNDLLKGKQWSDYQGGLIIGWKLSKVVGIFFEGEYTKFWDSKIYNSSVGLNLRL